MRLQRVALSRLSNVSTNNGRARKTLAHPVPATLEAIAATGAQMWRTDEHGNVTITFQGGQPVVSGER